MDNDKAIKAIRTFVHELQAKGEPLSISIFNKLKEFGMSDIAIYNAFNEEEKKDA